MGSERGVTPRVLVTTDDEAGDDHFRPDRVVELLGRGLAFVAGVEWDRSPQITLGDLGRNGRL
jgi:hypothetical protein